jgi:hypothetical protein
VRTKRSIHEFASQGFASQGFDRLAFRSAAWVLLFVIFVFAFVPTGFSQTRLGSAFDPSSSVVSLKESPRQSEERRVGTPSDGKPDRPAVAAIAGLQVQLVQVANSGAHKDRRTGRSLPPLRTDIPLGLPANSFQARAPPLA